MSVKQLGCGTVGELDDGRVAIAFDRHLRRAISDCEDRPGDGTARKVTITLEVKPLILEGAVDISVVAQIKGSIPNHVSRPTVCQIRSMNNAVGKVAAFNDLSGDNPRQGTIDEV